MTREHLGTPEHRGRCSPGTRGKPPLHTGNTENTAKTVGAPKYVLRSPVFGVCNLVPQEGLEPDGQALGYVELESAEGKLHMAVYQEGQWRGRNLKPFHAPVACWYKMVRPDGTEPF